MDELARLIALALVVAVFFWKADRHVGKCLNKMTYMKIPRPEGITHNDWRKIVWMGKGPSYPGAMWVGRFEFVAYALALVINQPVFIGAWLAFKVAAKWEVWKDVVRVPETLRGVDNEISWLKSRSAWGTVLLNRFLLGTLSNLLLAVLAFLFADRIGGPSLCWVWQHRDQIISVSSLAGGS